MSVSRITLDTDTEVFSTQESVMQGAIKEGYLVFVSDGTQGVGSVRQVEPDGRPELLVYIENAGDFVVSLTAIDNVHSEKVMLNIDQLDSRLREAIAHASDAEDQDYVSHSAEADDRNASLSKEFIDGQRMRLGELREQLLNTRGRPMGDERRFQEEHGDEARESEETAQNMQQNEVHQALHDVDAQRLRSIERALQKIEEGTYGLSDASGKPIPKGRLESIPEAILTMLEEQREETKNNRT